MSLITPLIAPEVTHIAPGFRALSITVQAAAISDPEVGARALDSAFAAMARGDAPWAEAHLSAWADVFRKFGAKPQRTPCSAEALRKRVARDGSLPSIDPIVDLYNAISIEYAIPVGGENQVAYQGIPRLVVADGSELFDTVKGGETAHESPEPGEVVWRDDKGVTCRRWNWRQGVRTRLSVESSKMWFILESLPEMPLEALHEAGEKLVAGIRQMMPGALIEQVLIGEQG
ncbi:B3/4 domain-containing protein [Aeromonas sp. FDAARGOS 1407]|uniref:B3/B4 domain-containing protein n=1 Tax=Aeromonas TaxID=642 RepID=UPI001C234D97|nr:B3/4 domain-containing protein [Aeromonas sp. FDAARGOS 1407]QXC35353.1 B3/4 domain-containing protein [Aeromonas sp. FDAARGOS 1407]